MILHLAGWSRCFCRSHTLSIICWLIQCGATARTATAPPCLGSSLNFADFFADSYHCESDSFFCRTHRGSSPLLTVSSVMCPRARDHGCEFKFVLILLLYLHPSFSTNNLWTSNSSYRSTDNNSLTVFNSIHDCLVVLLFWLNPIYYF